MTNQKKWLVTPLVVNQNKPGQVTAESAARAALLSWCREVQRLRGRASRGFCRRGGVWKAPLLGWQGSKPPGTRLLCFAFFLLCSFSLGGEAVKRRRVPQGSWVRGGFPAFHDVSEGSRVLGGPHMSLVLSPELIGAGGPTLRVR